MNGAKGFGEAAQLPEAVLDELLGRLCGVICTNRNGRVGGESLS